MARPAGNLSPYIQFVHQPNPQMRMRTDGPTEIKGSSGLVMAEANNVTWRDGLYWQFYVATSDGEVSQHRLTSESRSFRSEGGTLLKPFGPTAPVSLDKVKLQMTKVKDHLEIKQQLEQRYTALNMPMGSTKATGDPHKFKLAVRVVDSSGNAVCEPAYSHLVCNSDKYGVLQIIEVRDPDYAKPEGGKAFLLVSGGTTIITKERMYARFYTDTEEFDRVEVPLDHRYGTKRACIEVRYPEMYLNGEITRTVKLQLLTEQGLASESVDFTYRDQWASLRAPLDVLSDVSNYDDIRREDALPRQQQYNSIVCQTQVPTDALEENEFSEGTVEVHDEDVEDGEATNDVELPCEPEVQHGERVTRGRDMAEMEPEMEREMEPERRLPYSAATSDPLLSAAQTGSSSHDDPPAGDIIPEIQESLLSSAENDWLKFWLDQRLENMDLVDPVTTNGDPCLMYAGPSIGLSDLHDDVFTPSVPATHVPTDGALTTFAPTDGAPATIAPTDRAPATHVPSDAALTTCVPFDEASAAIVPSAKPPEMSLLAPRSAAWTLVKSQVDPPFPMTPVDPAPPSHPGTIAAASHSSTPLCSVVDEGFTNASPRLPRKRVHSLGRGPDHSPPVKVAKETPFDREKATSAVEAGAPITPPLLPEAPQFVVDLPIGWESEWDSEDSNCTLEELMSMIDSDSSSEGSDVA